MFCTRCHQGPSLLPSSDLWVLVMPRRRQLPLSNLIVTKFMHQPLCCRVTEEMPASFDVHQVIPGARQLCTGRRPVCLCAYYLLKMTAKSLAASTTTTRLALTRSDVDSGGSCWCLQSMKAASVSPSLNISLFVLTHAAISPNHDSSRFKALALSTPFISVLLLLLSLLLSIKGKISYVIHFLLSLFLAAAVIDSFIFPTLVLCLMP